MLSRSTSEEGTSSSAPEGAAAGETSPVAHRVAAGLGLREVHVWRARLDLARCDLDFISQCLSGDEWTKAHRFRFGIHQDRYAAGRAILRTLLGRYLGCLPEQVEVRETTWGKPCLAAGDGLQFNVSHSEDLLLIAVSRRPVGIDVEHIRPLEDIEMIAQSVFSRDEIETWRELEKEEKLEAFFRLWTRKEALLKGIGLGITEHAQAVSVFFDVASQVDVPAKLSKEKWIVQTFERVPWQVAAVATPISEPLFVEREFTTENWL